MTRLNPLMTVGDHLLDTLRAHRPDMEPSERRHRAQTLLEQVGIGAGRFRAYPHEFSGGMRQRLAIALAIALRPPLVIADEPTTSLDVAVAGQVMAVLRDLCDELGSALLLISHDLAMANRWCERMAVMDGGKVAEINSSDVVLTIPAPGLASVCFLPHAQGKAANTHGPRGRRGAGCAGTALLAQPGACPGGPTGSEPSTASAFSFRRARPWVWWGLRLREEHSLPSPDGADTNPWRTGQAAGATAAASAGSTERQARRTIQMVFRPTGLSQPSDDRGRSDWRSAADSWAGLAGEARRRPGTCWNAWG